jgi:hypothetical protein
VTTAVLLDRAMRTVTAPAANEATGRSANCSIS